MKEAMLESKERAEVIAKFGQLAEARFAANPEVRSLLFAVSQHWNDSADDETHRHVVESTRDVPVWPHECDRDYDDEGNPLASGERCSNCAWKDLSAPSIGIRAWEPWCYEGSNQSMSYGEAYQPVAIARRGAGVEWIGRVQRPEHDHAMFAAVTDEDSDARRWSSDPRAGELFAQVCAHPDDDGPRAVLADYLLEQRANDPRGELIALSLADRGSERRRAIVSTFGRRWFAPIESMCAADSIRYERGFVARVDVYTTAPELASCATWGTVRTLRYLPGSDNVLDPAMVALRDVGVVDGDGMEAIAGAPRPWAIQRLHADRSIRLLREATTLPALRELVVDAEEGSADAAPDALIENLRAAPWWPQLDRITFAMQDSADNLDGWLRRHAACGVPWLAVCDADPQSDGVSGFEVAFGPDAAAEIRVAGVSGTPTERRLAELALGLAAADRTITLVSSAHRSFTEYDTARLRAQLGIEVALR